MTLTQIVRPLQKSVSRLLLASANNAAATPNSAVDQVFSWGSPDQSSLQQQQSHGHGDWQQLASSLGSPLAPPVQSSPPAVEEISTWYNLTMDPSQLPKEEPDNSTDFARGTWSGMRAGSWVSMYYPAVASHTMHTDEASEVRSILGTASVSGVAGLPGRTGASRRQRRRQQQLQQQTQQRHNDKFQKSHVLQQLEHLQSYPQSFDQGSWRPTVHFDAEWSQLESWSAVLPCPLQEKPAAEQEDARGLGDMTLFPPTPEHSPCSSPRFHCGDGAGVAWADVAQLVLPAAPISMEYFEPYDMNAVTLSQWMPNVAALAESMPSPPDAEVESALKQLSAEDAEDRVGVLSWVVKHAWPLATSAAGCRLVQRALVLASESERLAIAEQMRGRVIEASTSPHANHVLQKCIELLQSEQLQFVLDEIQGEAVTTARHRFGCRVLERVIEKCPSSQTQPLLAEVLTSVAQLCRHTFGNFVVQHLLKHGTMLQRRAVAEMLYTDIQRLARHRVASHVVRSALAHCAPEDRQRLIAAMRADANELADLAHHHCGSFVVREMRRELRQ